MNQIVKDGAIMAHFRVKVVVTCQRIQARGKSMLVNTK